MPYIGYYLLGYYLGGKSLDKKKLPLALMVIMLMTVISFLGTVYLIPTYGFDAKGMFFLNRLNLNIMVSSILVFWIISHLDLEKIMGGNKKRLDLIKSSSSLTMGVYLVHPAVLEVFRRQSLFDSMIKEYPVGWMGLVFILTVLVSFWIVSRLKRIAFLKLTI